MHTLSGTGYVHCLRSEKVRRSLCPGSEQMEALWSRVGPVSPSEEAFGPAAWLSHPETEQPADGAPPSHASY